MNHTAARLRVIATAAVTWLVAASVIISAAAPMLAELLDAGDASALVAWSVSAVAALTAAASIIRRVTPVDPSERGILPPAERTTVPAGDAENEHPTERWSP